MARILRKRFYSFEECTVGKDNCLTFYNGFFHDQVDIQDFKNLIKLLKNSIKHSEILNNYINEENNKTSEAVRNSPRKEKEKPVLKSGFIYIIKCNHTGLFKIGSTTRNNPSVRIAELKTSNPSVEEYLVFKSDNIKEERYFHQQFESKKVSGEWFKLSELDIEEVKNFYNN